ncbi:hypothetical protein [Gloeobacter morelensis]|uniref:Uncharacterized protein n=1 Tax=Gloeobacter morelensis MG652769 TaxID=2781736 RepID=A0ABY3PGA1_9CYAN|nr:hypothetical protein [Gloeobacter morelensis]UFP92672.1 hypothetical protein ISF26_12555 [Gloeobacter morelensis MG652769]
MLWLVRLVLLAVAAGFFAWVAYENPLPAVWREVRCLPVYWRPTLPYPEFLSRLRAGEIRFVLLNPEQARIYVRKGDEQYAVRVPELDFTWQELLHEKRVRVVVLAEGGC